MGPWAAAVGEASGLPGSAAVADGLMGPIWLHPPWMRLMAADLMGHGAADPSGGLVAAEGQAATQLHRLHGSKHG